MHLGVLPRFCVQLLRPFPKAFVEIGFAEFKEPLIDRLVPVGVALLLHVADQQAVAIAMPMVSMFEALDSSTPFIALPVSDHVFDFVPLLGRGNSFALNGQDHFAQTPSLIFYQDSLNRRCGSIGSSASALARFVAKLNEV